MYYSPYRYPYPYYINRPMYNYGSQHVYWTIPNEIEQSKQLLFLQSSKEREQFELIDYD